MKKLLSLLSVLTISGTAVPTTIAASPYQDQEKLLKRNKRWGEVQWIQIAQQWRNAELEYQRAGEEFQRTQNHTAFSKAQQHFLQAQQSFNNSKNEWQQGLKQWANEITQERNQQWWNNIKSEQATQSEIQWVTNKTVALALKLGTNNVNKNKIVEIYSKKK
ncbi:MULTISPECIES: hypothetical protein [unclassified Spiroplasma]|uniref:hypothetical protein n=1 Tax=unclassified Spiroplasma TaxID=2637901 RepID=UPI0030D550EF